MLAAAVASCMSLMVTQEIAKAGLRHEYVKTESILTLEEEKHRWQISDIRLNITADVRQADAGKFEHACNRAKAKCPISHALKVPIKMTTLLQADIHAAAA
jgi:osmotically inducible protein OsmC